MLSTHQLPAQTTTFIGRTKELAEISALLLDYRLVTLVGPGGIGKTRLALETAAQLRGYRDGTCFVPLQPLDSSTYIVPTIADALDFKFFSNEDAKTQLLNYLRRKQMLLVLDNFEHLLDGVELVNELLTQAPQVSVLVTSRERLNLSGETVYPLQVLSDNSAFQLFIDRMARVRPDFRCSESDVHQIAEICRLVDGIPLAVVMAASWVNALSLAEIADEIRKSLDFLEIETRDVPARHRSMRAVFDQSWGLLSKDEQEVFARLTVFRGGFTRDAAQIVAGASLRTLSSLVNKSLLHRNGETGRYEIHELLRQYGEAKLHASGQEETTQQAYIAYFVDFMKRQWPRIKSRERLDAIAAIEADFENVRVMWLALIDQRRAEDLGKSAFSLWALIDVRDRFFEGCELFEQALEVVTEPTSARGCLLTGLGYIYAALNRLDEAEAVAREGLSVLEGSGLEDEILFAYFSLTKVLYYTPRDQEMIDIARQGIALAKACHNRWSVGVLSPWLGIGLMRLDADGDWQEALQVGQEAWTILNEAGEQYFTHVVSDVFSNVAARADNLLEVRHWQQTRLQIAEMNNKRWIVATAHRNLGDVEYKLGNLKAAQHHWRTSLFIYSELNITWLIFSIIHRFTSMFIQQNDLERVIEINALITGHKDANQFAKEHAEKELEELKLLVDEANYAAAVKRGESLDLYDVVDGLLQEFDPKATTSQNMQGLSPREMDVLKLLIEGRSNREIAKEMVFALGTVKWYISQIYSKLGVESRTQAIAKARELNLQL
jgi:predicted ATPase/DNA-binding NarL/FixJ family response regulator